MFNVNDNEFYKLTKLYANIDCTNYDVKANSSNCLTQLDTFVKNISYTKAQTDGFLNALNQDVTDI